MGDVHRMSKALREELENILILCHNYDPHVAADRLEKILGCKVAADDQSVIYPEVGHAWSRSWKCWSGIP